MGRGTGYVGLVGIMGDRFTAAQRASMPILDALKARGLLFVDDSDAAASVAGDRRTQLGMAWAVGDRSLDGDSAAPAIDKALADLETIARARRRGARPRPGSIR